jgi:hypothetical protein
VPYPVVDELAGVQLQIHWHGPIGKDVFVAYGLVGFTAKDALSRNRPDQERVESALKPCHCGGHFGMRNPPLCPRCGNGLRDLFPGPIYFCGPWATI